MGASRNLAMSSQPDEQWASDTIREMAKRCDAPTQVSSLGADPPSEGALAELAERVWNLYSDDLVLARMLLPGLLHHPASAIRAGAMRGIANMADSEPVMIEPYLESFRRGAMDLDPECRDAAAFGLQFSEHQEDEARLWELLDDDNDAVAVSAAYSLRAMRRATIDRELLSRRILDQDEWPLMRLILMERHFKEPDLCDIVRRAIDESRDALANGASYDGQLEEIEFRTSA